MTYPRRRFRNRWEILSPTVLASTTCMAMCSNGQRIVM
jgi:hypothetical protein